MRTLFKNVVGGQLAREVYVGRKPDHGVSATEVILRPSAGMLGLRNTCGSGMKLSGTNLSSKVNTNYIRKILGRWYINNLSHDNFGLVQMELVLTVAPPAQRAENRASAEKDVDALAQYCTDVI